MPNYFKNKSNSHFLDKNNSNDDNLFLNISNNYNITNEHFVSNDTCNKPFEITILLNNITVKFQIYTGI